MFKPYFEFYPTIKFPFYFQYTIINEGQKKVKEKLCQFMNTWKLINNGQKVEGTNAPLYNVDIKENVEYCTYSGKIGESLVIILNRYDDIIKILDNLSAEIADSPVNIKSSDIPSLDFLKKSRDKFQDILPDFPELFYTTIFKFYNFYNHEIHTYIERLKKEIKRIEESGNPIDTFGNTQYSLEEMKQQLEALSSFEFYKNECIEFLMNFKLLITALKMTIDKSFVAKSKNSNTKFYAGTNINLPKAKIEYKNSKHPKPYKHIYEFYEIQDLISIILYHLSVNDFVITKCGNCGDYFIPRIRNTEIYCKEIGKSKSFAENQKSNRPYDKLYKIIADRLRNNDNYKKNYFEKFQTEYNNLYNNFYTDEKEKNITIWKFLTDYDKKFQKEHPIKKGRPYTSNKYWYNSKIHNKK